MTAERPPMSANVRECPPCFWAKLLTTLGYAHRGLSLPGLSPPPPPQPTVPPLSRRGRSLTVAALLRLAERIEVGVGLGNREPPRLAMLPSDGLSCRKTRKPAGTAGGFPSKRGTGDVLGSTLVSVSLLRCGSSGLTACPRDPVPTAGGPRPCHRLARESSKSVVAWASKFCALQIWFCRCEPRDRGVVSYLRTCRNVWSAAPLQAKKKRAYWSAQMYTAFEWSQMTPGQDGMRCALDPFTYSVLEDFFLQRVSRAPGSTVVPSSWFVSKPGGKRKSSELGG